MEDDDGDSDFEDCSEEEHDVDAERTTEPIGDENDEALIRRIYSKRREAIPQLSQLMKSGKPVADTLPFILVSNLASFVFYSRYYNGDLLSVDPLKLSAVLVSQLLSIES